jgi:hypothetical protein
MGSGFRVLGFGLGGRTLSCTCPEPDTRNPEPAFCRNCFTILILSLIVLFSVSARGGEAPDQTDAPRAGSIVSSVPAEPAAPVNAFVPTSDYYQRQMQGFSLFVSRDVTVRIRERDAIYKELEKQLDNIRKVLTPEQYARLSKTKIWIEWDNPALNNPAAYLGSEAWIKLRGLNPEKLGCIEICSSTRFLQGAIRRPWMLMHELAHAWHFKVLGENHAGVLQAYADAMDKKLYDSVEYVEGTKKRRAYAAKNHIEYFAELTEAWFGKNDYFPFTRAQLEQHDPEGYKLMKEVWGETLKKK